ncbi:Phosphatidylethanolamine-binding PEBP [Pyrenophora seminiperda CCB06]|uniref:Phosphatidylethanolamine-binding PEBP n=1 Tax=Pyrenophora seminiperda CCB06 TaxID=1302712 RepID=A0A3M7M106_9PLEO|nr:Phosphatidylethanolamine-binding PEBP [Pyrenophora seminiperda CCB06]
MQFATAFALVALAGLAQAQVPNGFKPSVNTKLEVIYNSSMVMKAGQLFGKTDVQNQPQIALTSAMAGAKASDTYMFVMIDLDVPPADGSTKRRTLLHCMNTGFKATKQQVGGAATILASTEKGPANYIPPGPPATDTVAHRYVELLFAQPANLSVAKTEVTDRVGFDIAAFMTKHGLAAPMAGNFLMVDGRMNGTATAAPKASGTKGMASGKATPKASGTPPAQFPGAAGELSVPSGMVVKLGALVLAAMYVL